MKFDRRTMMLGAGMAMASACAMARDVEQTPWESWKERFIAPEGRVVDTGNGGISHSEGQGYGMLFAEAADDRATFDRLWGWTNATLSRPDVRLFSWRYDPAALPPVNDPNNATDGDILIGWALMRAARRWHVQEYETASQQIRVAIGTRLTVPVFGRTALLPGLAGFYIGQKATLNLAYYVWPALDAFAKADPEGPWASLIQHGEQLLRESRFGFAGLPTDWIDIDPFGPPRPAAGRPATFGFDAIRIPLYLAMSKRRQMLAPYAGFWRDPAMRPAWIDVFTGAQAPYSLSTGGQAIARVALGKSLVSTSIGPNDDYYSSTLLLLASMV
ncbi:endoglucanase [Sphingomonas oleivorans]|uniref:cellulase n=1 Tax=Sphingomonas oleivorans TaxID=1735121 RepID=A0A2T5FVX1_9SPHN|nr:glycosyl hydrolase family 8 [Sphingomonas oleivorans]PTQ09928.1 endoglucanase [Sphingomonas oleivorans]